MLVWLTYQMKNDRLPDKMVTHQTNPSNGTDKSFNDLNWDEHRLLNRERNSSGSSAFQFNLRQFDLTVAISCHSVAGKSFNCLKGEHKQPPVDYANKGESAIAVGIANLATSRSSWSRAQIVLPNGTRVISTVRSFLIDHRNEFNQSVAMVDDESDRSRAK